MNSFHCCLAVIACWTLCLLAPAAAAEDAFPDPLPELRRYEWTVTAATEPSPALRYRLFPDITGTVPGNAALHYLRAIALNNELPRSTREELDRESSWYQRRGNELPLDQVKRWLAARQIVLDEIANAARCDSCDWGIRFQELRGRDVIEIRLVEFQQARQLARILKLKAQVQIAERQYEEAIRTLGQLYRLSYDVGRAHSVIVSLVSTAILGIANDAAGELIASNGAPNLYWGLRLLPDPMLDRQAVTRLDVNTLFQLFPILNDAETVQQTPGQWRQSLSAAVHELKQMTDSGAGRSRDILQGLTTTMLVMRSYPAARQHLMVAGMTAARVEAMPAGQVVAIFARDCFRHVADEYQKWACLPYHEGEARLRQLDEQLKRDGYIAASPTDVAERDPLLFNRALLPSYLTGEAYIRQRRMIAMLAVVEAIRMHAADRGGLPERLADITRVPVPVDPSNQKPFHYRVVDGGAELVALPTRPGDEYSGRQIRLQMR